MLGSGIVTLPWTFYNSGVVLGTIISFLSFAASLRSCILILRLTGPKDDFYDTMKRYWGMPGYYVSMGGTLTVIMTACTAYYLIMAQMLYPNILAIIKWIGGKEMPLNTGAA